MTERHITPTMSLVQAESIVNEARESGVVTYAMPAHETEKFTKARELVAKALDAWNKGARAEVIHRILRLAGQHPEESYEAQAHEQAVEEGIKGDLAAARAVLDTNGPEIDPTAGQVTLPPADVAGAEGATPAASQNGSQTPSDPDDDTFGIDVGHVTPARRAALQRLKREGFAAPEMPTDEKLPVLPRDLTSLNDTQLRQASGVWNAYYTYANFSLVQEEADLHVCEFMESVEFDKAFAAIPKVDPDTGKSKLADIVKAEANAAPEVLKWKRRWLQHRTMSSFYKNLRDSYYSNVERISREMTARQQSWERSRG